MNGGLSVEGEGLGNDSCGEGLGIQDLELRFEGSSLEL